MNTRILEQSIFDLRKIHSEIEYSNVLLFNCSIVPPALGEWRKKKKPEGSCEKIYLYNALGNKLRKSVYQNGNLTNQMDYTSGAVYAASGGADHLGNVRVMFGDADNNGVAEVVQDNHYYPFGMTMTIPDGYPMSGLANPFRYQGKEFQEDAFTVNGTNVNLNLYDFHARQYDPELGRWHVPDPAAQYASPYMAMGNDPVMMVDPDGMKDGPGGKRKKGDVGDLTNLGPVDIPNYNLAPSPRDLGTMIVPITSIGCTGLIWQSADGTYVYIGQTSASLAIPADGYGGGGVNPAGMGCWRGGGCEGSSPYAPPAGSGGGNGWGGISYGNNNSNYIPDGKPTYAYKPRKPKNEVHGIVRNPQGQGGGQISMDASHNRIGFVPLDVGENYGAFQMANYRSNISVRGNQNQITVRATSSNTPVADGQVVFGARASLVVNGNITQTQVLANGLAVFKLPSSQNVSLTVNGGWTVRYDYGGAAVPVYHPIFWPFSLNFTDNFKLK